jgi:hypothetical protein
LRRQGVDSLWHTEVKYVRDRSIGN